MLSPRLGLDIRAADQFPFSGLIAQELAEQFGALTDAEAASLADLIVVHPRQQFCGPSRRLETKRRLGMAPWSWLWERDMVRGAALQVLHRVCPIDRMAPVSSCPTLTTVLPPEGALPFLPRLGVLSREARHYAVPSTADSELLAGRYRISAENITVVRPCVRRRLHFSPAPKRDESGRILVIGASALDKARLGRVLKLLRDRFPNHPVQGVQEGRRGELTPDSWLQHVGKAALVVYFPESPFDWGVLALESIFWNVPTIFSDGNAALRELLPQSPLRLSRFLLDAPSLDALTAAVARERDRLSAGGALDPLCMARQYAALYARLPGAAPCPTQSDEGNTQGA